MVEIKNNLESVRRRIAASCSACGRDPAQVGLLAVSKTFGPEAVAQAYAAGQLAFGENYIQEAVEKSRCWPVCRCSGIASARCKAIKPGW